MPRHSWKYTTVAAVIAWKLLLVVTMINHFQSLFSLITTSRLSALSNAKFLLLMLREAYNNYKCPFNWFNKRQGTEDLSQQTEKNWEIKPATNPDTGWKAENRTQQWGESLSNNKVFNINTTSIHLVFIILMVWCTVLKLNVHLQPVHFICE